MRILFLYILSILCFSSAQEWEEIDQPSRNNAGGVDISLQPKTSASESVILTYIKQKEILSEKYLATAPFLWTERDASGNIFPGDAVVMPPPAGKSYQLFSTISFKPFGGATYSAGDTIDIFASLRFVRFKGKPANLVKRVGRASVTKVEDKTLQALLFEMWDVIIGKERAAPASQSTALIIDTLIEPPSPITASVFTRVEQTESPYPLQSIILDKGSTHGIEIGDVFGIYHKESNDTPERFAAVGGVVNVGAFSSTLTIILMAQNRIDEGDKAVLIRRARYSQKRE